MRHSLRITAALVGLTAAVGAPAEAQSLTGAGATFPNPIYTKWFDAYHKETGVRINYQSIGSGGGIRQFTEGTVDFGATDGPMNDDQIAAFIADHPGFETLDVAKAWRQALITDIPPGLVTAGGGICLTPRRTNTDGFYCHLLRKAP